MANLTTLVEEMNKDVIVDEIQKRLDAGDDPFVLLKECMDGLTSIGAKFETGEAFLAELILGGEAFKAACNVLTPALAKTSNGESKGKLLVATLKGDIHYLGKGLFAVLAQGYGFEVEDMGEDVDPAAFVERMKEFKPDFVGFSSLLTPNMNEMKAAVDMMVEAGIRDSVKVLLGGGITSEFSRTFVGADFQTIEAMEGVKYMLKVVEGN